MIRKRIALLPSHPAQFWIMRGLATELERFSEIVWVMRDKDVLVDLAKSFGIQGEILSKAQTGLVSNATTLLADIARARKLQKKLDIDLWFTKYGAACIAARLSGRKAISFNDDDADIVPLIAWTAYPFAENVICLDTTRMGRFDKKSLRVAGNFELVYLHPNRFTPNSNSLREAGIDPQQPFALIRLSALTAHHDVGAKGVTEQLLREIIELAGDELRIFISSEKPLNDEFESYRLPIAPQHIHHALAHARFVLGDSQTMTVEAAILGTPALRISSFVGKLSYIDEVERYELAFGYKPGNENAAVSKVRELLSDPEVSKKTFSDRRQRFLNEKGDPLPRIVEYVRGSI